MSNKQNKSKMTKQQKRRSVLSLLLIIAVLVAGAFAYLTATDSKENIFTLGNVNIELQENCDVNLDGTLDVSETFDASKKTVTFTNKIMPGQFAIKQPYIKNTGKNAAWVFAVVGIPTEDFNKIKSNTFTNDLKIKVNAYAMQENYQAQNNAASVWKSYATKQHDTTIFNGKEVETNLDTRTQLFSLNNFDTDNWTKIDSYKSEDNYDYYVFAYESILNVGDTTVGYPFSNVQLNPNIGAPSENAMSLVSGDAIPMDYSLTIGDAVYSEGYIVPNEYKSGILTRSFNSGYTNYNVSFIYKNNQKGWNAQKNISIEALPQSLTDLNLDKYLVFEYITEYTYDEESESEDEYTTVNAYTGMGRDDFIDFMLDKENPDESEIDDYRYDFQNMYAGNSLPKLQTGSENVEVSYEFHNLDTGLCCEIVFNEEGSWVGIYWDGDATNYTLQGPTFLGYTISDIKVCLEDKDLSEVQIAFVDVSDETEVYVDVRSSCNINNYESGLFDGCLNLSSNLIKLCYTESDVPAALKNLLAAIANDYTYVSYIEHHKS